MYIKRSPTTGSRYVIHTKYLDGSSPTQQFDAHNYKNCLHLCMHALALIGDGERALKALDDGGVLHELLHLSQSIGIDLANTIEGVRNEVKQIEEDYLSRCNCSV